VGVVLFVRLIQMIEKIQSRKEILIKSILFFTVFFIILPITVQAINLGVLQKNTESVVKKGETTEFTIFFWGVEDSSSLLKFRVKSSEGMTVIIKPNELLLNSSATDYGEEEKEYINTPQGVKLMTPVKILVKAPGTIRYGNYTLAVVVTAGQPQTGISTIIEKTFLLKVSVVPSDLLKKGIETTETDKILSNLADDAMKKLTGMASAIAEGNNILLLFVSSIVIIVIYWAVKRRL
jgi:hypothetical protein